MTTYALTVFPFPGQSSQPYGVGETTAASFKAKKSQPSDIPKAAIHLPLKLVEIQRSIT